MTKDKDQMEVLLQDFSIDEQVYAAWADGLV